VTYVRDGDTIEIGIEAVRIEGLHAPESNTRLGQQAKRFVSDLVFGKFVTCWLNGEETHDRKVGVCFLAQQDIAARLVAEGFGRDCPAFSGRR
jgi:micrococcal nuclease